jgi:hypothetical protein
LNPHPKARRDNGTDPKPTIVPLVNYIRTNV